MPGHRSLKSRADFLLTRIPSVYAAALRYRPAGDPDKITFLNQVRPGDVVFDVGANLGTYTLLFSHLCGKHGQVHAFEPIPETFARLTARLDTDGHFGNVRLNQLAVADRAMDAVLFLPGTDHGQASMARHATGSWTGAPAVAEHTCRTTTLDAYVEEHRPARVDFVKCDVEGASLMVLKGAVMLLDRYRPVLHLELNDDWHRAFGYGNADVAGFLATAGYSHITIVGDRRGRPVPLDEMAGLDGSANILCRHRESATP